MRARLWIPVVMFVAGAGFFAAAGLAGPARKGGTLRIAQGRDFDSLDPAVLYETNGWGLEFATCAKLYNYPDKPAPAGAQVIPEVATAFPIVSKDGKTQTIQLKRTYRFHTGARVTAANFVAALNRDANPKLESAATTYLHEIVGADAVMAGKAQTISGLRALGPYTLRIRTTHLLPDLVSRLAMPFFCPIPTGTPLKEIDHPPGSGPYYIGSRVPNRQLVLERNRFYRGARPAKVDRIVWSIGLAGEACRQAVERNELDWCANGVPAADRADLVAKYGINKTQFFFNPTLTIFYFAFNHDRPAFKGLGQIPLKQAINWAIDRPELARAAGYLGGKRIDQILPPAMTRDASVYPLGGLTGKRLAKARALLAKAKLKPKSLVLYSPSFAPPGAWAQIFKFNLKKLGIDVTIKYFPNFGAMGPVVSTRGEPYDVAVAGWGADYADPIAFFAPLLDGNNLAQNGNSNWAYFDRPRWNREIERISHLLGEQRSQAWADLDVEMMRDDPPWAPFDNLAQTAFVSKSFGCYLYNPVFTLDLAATCKK
jgi:peptide/nickel transport system substrate-binding protein/oligopeptide transport system substrate-binding protein